MDLIERSSFRVEPGTSPDYSSNNPIMRLMTQMQQTQRAAEREHYLSGSEQFLFPFNSLELYGPAGNDADILDPVFQDNKNDFQKQNVRTFTLTDTLLIRGWARVGDWTGPFLHLSYRGGPDSVLSELANHQLGDRIKLFLQVRETASSTLIEVPYNPESDRYEVEFWGYPNGNGALRGQLGAKGQAALDSGALLVRPDLVPGQLSDFTRDTLSDLDMRQIAPNNAMHPLIPLHISLAWTDVTEQFWDSLNGANYQYEFNMIVRGWESYLKVGVSPNPHGGTGFLEYRNLLSNYFEFANSGELGRQLDWWNFNSFGQKVMEGSPTRQESFMAVDYMDLHVMRPECAIGLHRHRDNQEIFFMIEGRGYMVVGDWAKFPNRERCFEIRTLKSGHFAMLKGGNLHGLVNSTDENCSLFMLGGYD